MIQTKDLIAKFQHALDNNWGYIWGETCVMWSAAKQASYARAYKDSADRANSVKYGGKWAGHYVTDCSGLFAWAFKQLGGYMYHGSNTMYRDYCTAKGKLSKGKRTDGKDLKPGTAVFTGTDVKHGHVGLYIGNGLVIEAAGTLEGVITSSVASKKWTFWGELKGVNYESQNEESEVLIIVEYAKVRGGTLNLRQKPDKGSSLITQIPTGTTVAIVEETNDTWCKIVYDSYTGYVMKKYLSFEDDSNSTTSNNISIILSRDCAVTLYEALKSSLNK